MHPLGGLHHLLAMIAVGLLAVTMGGRAHCALPVTFLAFMGLGGVVGMQGVAMPYVEIGIALSVLLLGRAVAIRWRWPPAPALPLIGAFAVFDGRAHGAEMPLDASGLSYALGFFLATGLLHPIGIGLGSVGGGYAGRLTQTGGAALTLAGVALLTGGL